MLVSAIEKKADTASSAASAASCHFNGMSKSCGEGGGRAQYSSQPSRLPSSQAAAEDDLDDEPAADVGEQQHHEAGERPAQRTPPAPTVAPAPGEQEAEDHARQDREHRLVVEAQRPAEHLLGVDRASDERQRQQHK